MGRNLRKPIRIVGHWTFYVDRKNDFFPDARQLMLSFASLKIRTPSLYAYRQDLGYLWNAFSRGVTGEDILGQMKPLVKMPIPFALKQELIVKHYNYSRLVLDGELSSRVVLAGREYSHNELGLLKYRNASDRLAILDRRKATFSCEALCECDACLERSLRGYQRSIIEDILSSGRSGVLTLPCGSGKTLIGLGVITAIKRPAIVFVPTRTAADQWISEVAKWSSAKYRLTELGGGWKRAEDISRQKWWLVGPWTNIPTAVRGMFSEIGLAIYDEIHAWPISQFVDISCFCFDLRLGLTGSLIREDEGLLFIHNLIGPVLYHISCEEMYRQGCITVPQCVELKVPIERNSASTPPIKEAATNPMKMDILARLLNKHAGDAILVFAAYNDQLESIAGRFGIPCLTGATSVGRRLSLIENFNSGKIDILGLSKSWSSALDLPRASVGIQLSGSSSSRNEEMQHIGRIMRSHPKDVRCVFYTLVSEGTREEELAASRQMYMMEHGIPYIAGDSDEV